MAEIGGCGKPQTDGDDEVFCEKTSVSASGKKCCKLECGGGDRCPGGASPGASEESRDSCSDSDSDFSEFEGKINELLICKLSTKLIVCIALPAMTFITELPVYRGVGRWFEAGSKTNLGCWGVQSVESNVEPLKSIMVMQ